jgi:hypothetical protein
MGIKPNIELSISELIFHGYSARDAHRIKDALERELTRLFNQRGLPSNHVTEINLPVLQLGTLSTKGFSAESTGYAIANEVYRGVNRPAPESLPPSNNQYSEI